MSNFQQIQLTPETAQEARAAVSDAASRTDGRSQAPAEPTKEPQTNSEVPVKPAFVPDKFWNGKEVNWEALAKSYTELEKSKPQPKPADAHKEEAQKAEQKPKEEAEQKPAPVVLDQATYQRYSEEVIASGKLSEESYKELAEKYNVSREVAEAHIAAVTAKNELNAQKITALAGGDEGYQAMIGWAKNELSQAEQAAFDKIVTHGSEAEITTAVRGLHARFIQAEGRAPRRILGGSGGPAIEPFRSSAQLSAAIRDPRYATDPSYREDVQRRLAVSDVL